MPPHLLTNRDPGEIKQMEWQDFANQIESKYQKQMEVNNKLSDDFMRRQTRYRKREEEYRRRIEELQRELRIRLGYEVNAYDKNMMVINALRDELDANIDGIDDKIMSLKDEQEQDIIRKFSTDINKLKAEIENTTSNKGNSTANMKDRENKLQQHLVVISSIAQRIENENRALMKKNTELKKEYQSQENDRELLLKQLVMLKKENAKTKEEIDYYNRIVEEKKEEEGENIPVKSTPAKSQKSSSKRTKSRTLLNSRKNTKREGMPLGVDSMRHSTGMFGMAQGIRNEDLGTINPLQKPQETEEDKIKRYERIIEKLKKTLDFERKNLKSARTQYQSEMQHKTELEEMLKECVNQVQAEILKRNKDPKTSAINNLQKKGKKLSSINDIEFTQQDRERVIELLLSQEKVLYLLYEKTFPNEEGEADSPKVETERNKGDGERYVSNLNDDEILAMDSDKE